MKLPVTIVPAPARLAMSVAVVRSIAAASAFPSCFWMSNIRCTLTTSRAPSRLRLVVRRFTSARSRPGRPDWLSNHVTATVGLPDVGDTGTSRDHGCQRNRPAAATTRTAAAASSQRGPIGIVIRVDVVRLAGTGRAVVVGGPCSILSSAARTSAALWYLAALSFARHFRMSAPSAVGICALSVLGSAGVSCFCLCATASGVWPSNGTLPVAIS